jgi:hypothetical protein
MVKLLPPPVKVPSPPFEARHVEPDRDGESM